ncbi:hypothetical protein MTR67_002336 [Solanum verrucosum]|uniref:Uncharacterized protein n=1 Tax=Solanum verrucosum TaxID=315347 RepID=A0AAF0PUI4_SOLVR|nr:hypothetical protein MTR67_002336 [Solanum verrucosum]
MSPNDLEHDDVEGWCKTAMNYTKGRVLKLEEEERFISKDLDLDLLDSSFLACNKT